MEIHAHNREGKARRPFLPISSIVRSPKGRPLGRLIRHELRQVVEAYGIGFFSTEQAARRAIRAKHGARR